MEPDPGAVLPDHPAGLHQELLAFFIIQLHSGSLHELVIFRVAVEGRAQSLGGIHLAGELPVESHIRIQEKRTPTQEKDLQLRLLQGLQQPGHIGGPIIGSKLHLNPDGLQIGLYGLGNLFVKEVAAVGRAHTHDCVIIKPGFVQERLGLVRIIVILLVHGLVAEDNGRNRGVHGHGGPKEDLFDDGLFIHGIIKGLAHKLVLGHPFLAVQAHEDGPGVQGHVHGHIGIGLEAGDIRRRRFITDVDLSGTEHGFPGGNLRNHLPDDLFHRGFFSKIVLIADHDDPVPLDPLFEDIRAGSHRMLPDVLPVFFQGFR